MLINESFHYALYYENECHFHNIKRRCQVFLFDPDWYPNINGRKFKHYPCKSIPDIISFSPYDCFSLNLGHILFNGSGLYMRTYIIRGESNVT